MGVLYGLRVKQSATSRRMSARSSRARAVVAEGPFGSMTDLARTRDKVVLIAGGIGITPLRALAETMTGDVILVYRAMSDDDIIFRDELEALAENRGITIHYVLGDHRVPKNKKLLSPEHLRRLIPDVASREIYLSGPPAMVEALEHNVRHARSAASIYPCRAIRPVDTCKGHCMDRISHSRLTGGRGSRLP